MRGREGNGSTGRFGSCRGLAMCNKTISCFLVFREIEIGIKMEIERGREGR
jgi:hypothetical protein